MSNNSRYLFFHKLFVILQEYSWCISVFLKTISNLLVAEVCVRELGLLNPTTLDFMLCSIYKPYIKTEFIFCMLFLIDCYIDR